MKRNQKQRWTKEWKAYLQSTWMIIRVSKKKMFWPFFLVFSNWINLIISDTEMKRGTIILIFFISLFWRAFIYSLEFKKSKKDEDEDEAGAKNREREREVDREKKVKVWIKREEWIGQKQLLFICIHFIDKKISGLAKRAYIIYSIFTLPLLQPTLHLLYSHSWAALRTSSSCLLHAWYTCTLAMTIIFLTYF